MKSKYIFRFAISCFVLAAFVALTATVMSAQVKPTDKTKDVVKTVLSPDAPYEEDDEKLDDSFRKFGEAAGAAYQCAAADADKEKIVADVRRAFNRIGQLFGTDRAFNFSAYFGKATVEPFDKAKCAELATKLRESVLVKRVLN